jgi:hypothetical protein
MQLNVRGGLVGFFFDVLRQRLTHSESNSSFNCRVSGSLYSKFTNPSLKKDYWNQLVLKSC